MDNDATIEFVARHRRRPEAKINPLVHILWITVAFAGLELLILGALMLLGVIQVK